ncbi:hypothetical protein [Luteolibacter sp. Populi]|uniref:hypothetical protein n=1 Tax=Luteolibacter sp. Populi TaxID=3230487 RepID=UPI003466C37E
MSFVPAGDDVDGEEEAALTGVPPGPGDTADPPPLPDLLDRLEAAMVGHAVAECEVINRFTPGLYIRECRMKAGTLGVSMIHAVEHPFIVSEGVVAVTSEAEGTVIYAAPHTGITRPGTRRALYAHTDVVWTTIHPNPGDGREVAAIVARVTEPHDNPAVPAELANQWRLNNITLGISE